MQFIKTYKINAKEETEFDTTGKTIKDYHTVDATTIAKLEALGFEGIDASLETSILEYGMAWANKDSEWYFIHRHSNVNNVFDSASFPEDTDWRSEFPWVLDSLEEFLSYIDMTEEEFDAESLPIKIYQIENYWGVENVFGTSYYSGFLVFSDGKNRRQEYINICKEDEL